MNFFQAGFLRLTDRDVETTMAIFFCQPEIVASWLFFQSLRLRPFSIPVSGVGVLIGMLE